jgi:hypothetical protein
MALNKLPCEYPEIGIKRAEECFGDLSDKEKKHLLNIFQKAADKFEEIRWKTAAGN